MTAKDKAIQIVDSFYCKKDGIGLSFCVNYSNAKTAALICVNQIISANPQSNPLNTSVYSTMDFWLEVRNEISEL